ncbi:hypothetical protein L596_014557 [Steinernema carpocapsae]|uniref:Uncharacterized protein n=1 Tax=Steinernema carpocapsae TaxID=34508 RepID=A0A4U5ND24_STECR|nr:hypothetical protein L596_014557 [Steinernema carpocapsae]
MSPWSAAAMFQQPLDEIELPSTTAFLHDIFYMERRDMRRELPRVLPLFTDHDANTREVAFAAALHILATLWRLRDREEMANLRQQVVLSYREALSSSSHAIACHALSVLPDYTREIGLTTHSEHILRVAMSVCQRSNMGNAYPAIGKAIAELVRGRSYR